MLSPNKRVVNILLMPLKFRHHQEQDSDFDCNICLYRSLCLCTKHFTRIMFPGSVNPQLAVYFSRHLCLNTYFERSVEKCRKSELNPKYMLILSSVGCNSFFYYFFTMRVSVLIASPFGGL